jgi:hypothetical protein
MVRRLLPQAHIERVAFAEAVAHGQVREDENRRVWPAVKEATTEREIMDAAS